MTFAEKLKTLRAEHGITQQDLAVITGISRVSIGFYENGRMPPVSAIQKFAAALGVPVTYLLPGCCDEDRDLNRYEAAFSELESAGYHCEPIDADRNAIALPDGGSVVADNAEVIRMVESVLADAERRKNEYIRKRIAAELCEFDGL